MLRAMISDRAKGIGMMVVAAIAFAGMSALMKAASRIHVLEIVFFRGFVGWLVLVVAERLRQQPVRSAVRPGRIFLRSLFGFGGLTTYVWAIHHIGLGVASALNQSSPVFVAVLSLLILRERPPRAVPVLVVVACAGAWLIIAPDLTSIDMNAMVGLVSAVLSATAYTIVRELRHTDTPWVIVRGFSGWTVVFSLPFLVVVGWQWPQGIEWAVLLGLGALALIGQLAITRAYSLAEASIVSPFIYLSVVANLALGWAFWGEWPVARALAGVGIVVVASLLIGWLSARTTTAPPRPARGRKGA